jgi:hypothetical protein
MCTEPEDWLIAHILGQEWGKIPAFSNVNTSGEGQQNLGQFSKLRSLINALIYAVGNFMLAIIICQTVI